LPVPTCGKCREPHYNFFTCEDAARRAALISAASAAEAARTRVQVEWKSDLDREWGADKTDTWNIQGNMFWRKRG
jgi:hypothetical protein